jgi:periplasmic divalent cation tolerance protein
VVLCTAPDEETAASMARNLVESGLIACASISRARSVYMWKGQVNDEEEWFMIMKTRTSLVKKVIDAVVERHPYEVPEVISFRISEAHLPYLEWIADVTLD